MVDFLISYKNNTAKIGRGKSRITSENDERILTENGDYIIDPQSITFRVKSLNLDKAILAEDDIYLVTEDDTFLVWEDT